MKPSVSLQTALVLSITFLLLGSLIPVPPADASHAPADPSDPSDPGHESPDLPIPCVFSYIEGLGNACQLANGAWKIMHSDGTTGFTPGPSPAPGSPAWPDDGLVPMDHGGSRPPLCAQNPSTDYHHVLIYARASNDDDRYASIAPPLRDLIHQINGHLNTEGRAAGAVSADYIFHCSGGQVTVFNEALPTPKNQADFNSIVTDLRSRGYDDHWVKYWVWYDDQGACTCGGIGHIYFDDRNILENFNNGRSNAVSMYGVTFGYLSSAGHRIMMHENGHNMGAVQLSAPNASPGGGHCNDGQDIMCYDDSGFGNPSQYNPNVCTGHMRFDCNKDDYFNPVPPPGSYLATHWNVGSQLNRFLEIELNSPPVMQDLSCSPEPSSVEETVTCTFYADDISNGVHYLVEWGDGSTTRVPTSGTVPPGETQTAQYDWEQSGTFTVRVRATDNLDPPLTSGPLEVQQEVLGPVAIAAVDPQRANPGATFTLDGTGSHSPVSNIVAYEWTLDGSVVSQQAIHTLALEDPGAHCFTLQVTDDHGVISTDSVCPEVNHAPVAVAVADPSLAFLDEPVTMDGTGSHDPDGDIVAYQWTQGGQVVSTQASFTLSFDTLGEHCYQLLVTDDEGLTGTDTACVEIVDPEPPTAVATANIAEANRGYLVRFDGSDSSDTNPGDVELSYEWRLDGATVSQSAVYTRSFSTTGEKCLELTVSNPWFSDTDTVCVQITNEYRVSATPTQDTFTPNQQPSVDVVVTQITGERVGGAIVELTVQYASGVPAIDDALASTGCGANWTGTGTTINGFVRINVPSLAARCLGLTTSGELTGTWHVTASATRDGNEGTDETQYNVGV
jgi:hypothetical protein